MKRLLLTLSGLLVASAGYAQIGVRLGGNIANFRTTSGEVFTSSTISRSGYQAGIFYRVPLTRRLALVPEVQYSRERLTYAQASYGIVDSYFNGESRQYLSYLNVPVLLRVTLGPVYVEAGPQGGFLLGGRQEGFTITSSFWTSTASYHDLQGSPTDRFRRVDVGACVGLGAKLPLGLGVSLRAYQGLLSLTGDNSVAEGKAYRQNVQASLTYQLAAH